MQRLFFLQLLFCLFFVGLILGSFSRDCLAQETSRWHKLSLQVQEGKATIEELSQALLRQAETAQQQILEPENYILKFPTIIEILGPMLERRSAELIQQRNIEALRQLTLFTQRMFGDASRYTQAVQRNQLLQEKYDALVTRGTAESVGLFRTELSTERERQLFLPLIEEFLSKALEQQASQPPQIAFRNLAKLSGIAQMPSLNQKAVDLLALMAQQATRGELDLTIWVFEDSAVKKFINALGAEKEKAEGIIAELYGARILWLSKNSQHAELPSAWASLLRLRPDPSQANDVLRYQVLFALKGEGAQEVASQLIRELNAAGKLGIFDKLSLYRRGYYGHGLLLMVMAGVVGFFLGCFAIFAVIHKRDPELFSRLHERVQRWRKKRVEEKGKRRGVGYLSVVEVEDEQSRLLKEFGLDDSASLEDIKKAYRRLMKEFHPDTHGNSGAISLNKEELEQRFDYLKKKYERLMQMRGAYFSK